MCLHRADRASEATYIRLIRETFETRGGRSGLRRADWRTFTTAGGASSIAALIADADAADAARRNERRAASQARAVAVIEAERVALGEPPALDQKRRQDGKLWHQSLRSTSGRAVADFPDLLETWDREPNGRDPAEVPAGERAQAWWICRAHEHYPIPHVHRWEAVINERASRSYGCRFCMNREVCPSNNLLALHRRLVEREWDFEANGDLRPEAFLPGARDKVMWKCVRPGREHPSFAQVIAKRAKLGQGCPECAREDAVERQRERRRESTTNAVVTTLIPLDELDAVGF